MTAPLNIDPTAQATATGYSDRPVTKPPNWHGLVTLDLLLNNLSSGLFLVAALGELVVPESFRPLAALAYPIALLFLIGDLVCLVLDLGDPFRFHHMLRVWKPSSPMSLGTWCLAAYAVPLTALTVMGLVPGERGSRVGTPADSRRRPGARGGCGGIQGRPVQHHGAARLGGRPMAGRLPGQLGPGAGRGRAAAPGNGRAATPGRDRAPSRAEAAAAPEPAGPGSAPGRSSRPAVGGPWFPRSRGHRHAGDRGGHSRAAVVVGARRAGRHTQGRCS